MLGWSFYLSVFHGTGLPTYLPVRLVTTSSGGLTKEKAGAQKDAMSRSAALENMVNLHKVL